MEAAVNDTAKLNWNGRKVELEHGGCGREAMQNRERSFWQSRAGMERPPELVDLRALASEIRSGRP